VLPLTRTLREQEAVPKKLIVIGSGYIGLEFSCIFDNLGTEVHIMFRQDKPLRGFDEEVSLDWPVCSSATFLLWQHTRYCQCVGHMQGPWGMACCRCDSG